MVIIPCFYDNPSDFPAKMQKYFIFSCDGWFIWLNKLDVEGETACAATLQQSRILTAHNYP